MKITLKTLKGEQVPIEVDAGDKVLAVKEKIEKEHNLGSAAGMKLIFSGKIMNDPQTVGEYNVSEGDFLVVMVSKPKATAPAPAPAPDVAPAAPTPAAPEPTPTSTADTNPPAATAPVPAPEPTPTPSPDMAGDTELDATVKQLMDMGFPKEQVQAALRAAYNNPERAVEYLMTGIPESAVMDTAPPPAAGGGDAPPPVAPAGGGTPPAPGDPAPLFNPANLMGGGLDQPAAGESPLAPLRNHPQFAQMVQLIQSNPNLLQPLLQEIGQSNPQLLQLINNNQQEFARLINEPMAPGGGAAGGGAAPPGGGGGAAPPPGSNYIQVTPEEREAIERLEQLGFDRAAVLEAYLACDKNEMLAANFLFDNAGGEE